MDICGVMLYLFFLTIVVNANGHKESPYMVDLSHPFSDKTIYWPGMKKFSLINIIRGYTQEGIWLEANHFAAAEHGGTHIDAPAHFAENGWTVDEIPLERLVGPAVVVDISEKAATNPDAQLMVDDLIEWEKKHGQIPFGAIVLVHSDWAKRWPDQEKYFGNADGDTTQSHFPSFHIDAAKWLTENREIYGIGLDTPSPDYGSSTTYPVHIHFLSLGIYGLENVNNLDKIPASGAMLYSFPMKIKGGSGGPCRIVAMMGSEPLLWRHKRVKTYKLDL